MFTKKTPEPTGLDMVIEELQEHIRRTDCYTKEYPILVDNLSKLYKMKEANTSRRVSPDTIAIIAGNLAGIVLILGYERVGIVTSKALSFVMKAK